MHKLLGIGIPKTGTVYRESTMKGIAPRAHYDKTGIKPAEYFTTEVPESDYSFAFVRNPFDLLVSHYSFIKREDVKEHHPDADLGGKTFSEYLKIVSTRETGYPNKGSLFFQILDNGKVTVDFVGKYENMDSDIEKLCAKFGCEYEKGERKNASERGDWKDYYTPEDRKLVEDTWGNDLKLFGYSW